MEMNRELQLFVLSGLRKDRGPQFSKGVSLKNDMLGEQITAGQLTNKECTVMPIHVSKITTTSDLYKVSAGFNMLRASCM